MRQIRIPLLFAALFSTVAVCGQQAASGGSPPADILYAQPGKLVSVNGFRLNLYCMGSGSPTVVFDSGWGDWAPAWSKVQPEVVKWTRACSYDRAGTGFSDPGPMPRTSVRIAKELRTALHRAGIGGPYILVGSAFGGDNVRTFADLYMGEVAGLVLIDADSDDVGPKAMQEEAHRGHAGIPSDLRDCRNLIAEHKRLPAQPAGPGQLPKTCAQQFFFRGLPEAEWSPELNAKLLEIAQTKVVMYDAYSSEMEQTPADETWLQQHRRSFGSRPIRVLTSGNHGVGHLEKKPQDTPKHLKYEQENTLAQARWLGLSSNAKQIFARNSSEYIQFDEPETVINAIREEVDQTHGTSELKPVDAVQGIVGAFKQHPVVIIGERHGYKEAGDFYIKLVQDPKFQETVQDIVVEFVSRNNQSLLDRYISGGNVSKEDIRHLWRDTTKVASWESPIYADWLAAIRQVNQKLPPARRLRVLAGDTAVDWTRLHTRADWAALGDNNVSLADVVMQEVLEKKHHALVVLGSNHITKFGDRNGNANTTTLIENRFPGSTYVVLTLFARLMPDTVEDRLQLPIRESPALYDLAGTAAAGLTADQNGPPLIKQTDALLYLRPRGGFADTAYPPDSFDYAYVKEVERRSMIEWGDLRVRDVTGPKYPESDIPVHEGMSPRIELLKKQLQEGNKSAIEQFWTEVKGAGTPLIETVPSDASHPLVTFLYRGNENTKSVGVYSQLSGSNDSDPAMQLTGTDIWYRTYAVRSDMHLGYSFVVNSPKGPTGSDLDLQTADPFNPKAGSTTPYMGRSVLELPSAQPQPWLAPRPGVLAGKLEGIQIDSEVLMAQRQAWVYTPAGYDPKRAEPYPMLVCFDGLGYASTDYVPGPTILDNLVAAGKIPPMIMVLIGQSPQPERNIELGNNQPFLDYVANELLPNVRQKWHATSDPRKTVVCGSSSGGLASAFFAMRRPDVFGNVLSQSGAFWPGHVREDAEREWLTRQYEASPKLPVRFVLQVGVVEIGHTPNNGPSILVCNRHLRDVLYAKGNELYYSERAGSHEPLNWSGGLAEGLIQLMGGN